MYLIFLKKLWETETFICFFFKREAFHKDQWEISKKEGPGHPPTHPLGSASDLYFQLEFGHRYANGVWWMVDTVTGKAMRVPICCLANNLPEQRVMIHRLLEKSSLGRVWLSLMWVGWSIPYPWGYYGV